MKQQRIRPTIEQLRSIPTDSMSAMYWRGVLKHFSMLLPDAFLIKQIQRNVTFFSTVVLLLLFYVTPASASCVTNNHVRPADVVSDDVNKLFEEKNYKKLDELAFQYEKEKTLTFDSNSALMAFYRGIAQSFSNCSPVNKTEDEWLAHQKSISDWIKSSPNSTAAKLALALFTIDYGWHGRGNGYASTVNDKAMSLFKSRMSLARDQLDQLADLCKKNPAWYSGMLDLALAQGREPDEFDALYKKAVQLDPYYLNFHYASASFHSKFWYGTDNKMRNSIEKSVELTKNRLGQSMYARLHWTQSKSPEMFKTGGVNWTRMKTGFDDALKIYPDNRTRNSYAMFACMADDAKNLKKQLDLLGDRVNQQIWTDKNFYLYCKAIAKNSESGKETQCFRREDTGEVFCQ